MNRLKHIAFIMDGNGRWGIKKRRGRNYGHLKGVEVVQNIVKASISFKIPVITFFVFSTENWKRPKTEINFLFKLINSYFEKEIHDVMKNRIKINFLGKLSNIPKKTKETIKKTIQITKKNKNILVNLAINYGSKSEIIDSFKKIKKNKSKISKTSIENNLYTTNLPDPDILIRTGGKKRLSNFMLWQLAYTELYFLDKLWPEFNKKDLSKIISKYKKIKRNFGGI